MVLGSLILLLIIGFPIFTVVRLLGLTAQVRLLEKRLAGQESSLAAIRPLSAVAAAAVPASGREEARSTAEPPGDEEPELPLATATTIGPDASGRTPTGEPAAAPAPVAASARVPKVVRATGSQPAAGQAAARSFEEALASQWMVWLGALAIGLSAVFLFTYAAEQGWLGPTTRVALGLLLGAALIGAGEWMHRLDPAAVARAARADFVPPALTASGLFALFVSLFAAHALYGLLPAWLAFLALGAVAFAALALSLRHGWFVALLGLVGGFTVPAMLESEAHDPLPVFLYLFAVAAGCLGLMVWRRWWWLAFATLTGALAWPALWLLGPWSPADQGVLGVYAVALAGLFALFSVGLPVKIPGTPATAWLVAVLSDTSGLGFALTGALVVLLAIVHDFNDAAFVFLGLYAAVGLGFGLRRAAFEGLAVVGALVTAVAILAWPVPAEVSAPSEIARLGVESYRTAFGPYVMPPEFVVFARSLLVFAGMFGVGGFLALRRAETPAVWSAISAAMPLYFFVMGYWRIGAFEIDVQWAALAFGLAVLNLGAAALAPRVLAGRHSDVPLAFYAAGCTAALALTFTCLLREAWLTVAISLEVVALGWLWTRLKVEELRLIGFAAVAVVIVRLVLNYEIVDYDAAGGGMLSWVIYGYGIPAVAFLFAARLFRTDSSDPLAMLCEIAGIGFAFLLVALQLRIWTSGDIDVPRYDLFDQAVQSVWWLIAAALLLRRELDERAPWAWFVGAGLLGLSVLQIALGQVIANNPVLTDEPVGDLPLLNLLGLAYLLPAAMLWVLATDRGFAITPELRQVLRIGASALLFIYITLEVRHLFWGSTMQLTWETGPTDAEVYAYSAAWIVYALALLGLGIIWQASFWRYSSMAVLVATVLKVFLYDLSDLAGLLRVASFLGLGLTLIGIGYIYRRFVFREGGAVAS